MKTPQPVLPLYVCIFYPVLAILRYRLSNDPTLLKRQGRKLFLDFPKINIESNRFFYKKKEEEMVNSLTQDNDNTGVVLEVLQLCCSKLRVMSGSALKSAKVRTQCKLVIQRCLVYKSLDVWITLLYYYILFYLLESFDYCYLPLCALVLSVRTLRENRFWK